MTDIAQTENFAAETPASDPNAPKLEVRRFYVKEQSCKVPHAPGIFSAEGKPETQVEMSTQKNKRDNGEVEISLTLHITLKIGQQTGLILQIEQVGTFMLQGFTTEQENQLLGAYCPSLLYPYARKAIADLSLSAGFAGINLPPVNFDQMYLQQQEQAKKQTESTPSASAANVLEAGTA